MIYSRWGNREDGPLVSKLGFGTTRFNPEDIVNEKGRARCSELVEYAIEKGINYFDVAPTYSNGYAEEILGNAFMHVKNTVYVAAKTGLMIDKTCSEARRRIEQSLKLLHRERIDFYHIWSVLNLEQLEEVLRKDGIYEGCMKAKEEGLINHLCISLHCDLNDAQIILNKGLFEGIVISANVMNYQKWIPMMKAAASKKVAVIIMNSLGGGVIPRYAPLFKMIDSTEDPVPVKALRYMASFPEISVLLSGMPTKEMIDENVSAFDVAENVNVRNEFEIRVNETLCSGCGYCSPCSVGIPISSCMQAYNHRILVETEKSIRANLTETTEKQLNIDANENQKSNGLANEIFTRIRANGVVFPDLNRCISCGVCETRCTQKIPIRCRMKWLESEAVAHGYSNYEMKNRLKEIEQTCGDCKLVGIWPAADYASRVLDYWDNAEFEKKCVYFNASMAMKGKVFRGRRILSAEEIEISGIEAMIVMHFRLQEEIRSYLKQKLPKNVKLICLHRGEDIDWFNRMIM